MKPIIPKLAMNVYRTCAFILMSITAASASATDEYTVELYDTYCKACHSTAGAGVPVAFDKDEWTMRMKKGVEALVNNAVNGIGNMPAQGFCQECTYEDFEDLVSYMSTPK